jgi:type III pantothenate kinase
VHGALRYVAGGPLLVLDVGTAVTYDYVDETDTFLGGGIAPGLSMRYQALHAFSARLPQLAPGPAIQWLGGTTEEAIRAGVQFGLAAELQAHINWAHQQRPDQPPPAVFLTGGNAPYFEPLLQEAVHRTCPNLVLEGICQLVASPAAFAD